MVATIANRGLAVSLYFPHILVRGAPGVRDVTEVPAFPGYCFVSWDGEIYGPHQISEWMPQARDFLGVGGRWSEGFPIYWLENREIVEIKRAVSSWNKMATPVAARTALVGRNVSIVGSAFAGFAGTCEDVRGDYATVRIGMFSGREVSVAIPLQAVEEYHVRSWDGVL